MILANLTIWIAFMVIATVLTIAGIMLIGGFCWCLAFLVGYIRAIIKLRRRE